MTKEWLSALEHGKEVCAVVFDYWKGFDSVPHLHLGFNDHILHWVSGYLAIVVPNLLWLMVNLLCLLLLFLEYHRHCSWSPFSDLY